MLLRYNGTDLRRRDDLKLVAPGDSAPARVPVRIWRLVQEEGASVVRTLDLTVRPGPLGVTLANEPAPVAGSSEGYRTDEEAAVRARLQELGYID